MTKIIRICIVALWFIICGGVNVYAHDTPADFRAAIGISTRTELSFGSGVCKDLPHPDYRNRFHILIYLPYTKSINNINNGNELIRTRHLTNIRVQAIAHGLMEVEIPNWGLIELLPAESHIRQFMRDAAPLYEIRAQYVTIRIIEDGLLEVYIEEPKSTPALITMPYTHK